MRHLGGEGEGEVEAGNHENDGLSDLLHWLAV